MLRNGISLPVSRSYQKEIQQKFLKMRDRFKFCVNVKN